METALTLLLNETASTVSPLWLLAYMVAIVFFSLVHEFGHWLAAEAMGAKGGKLKIKILHKYIPLPILAVLLSDESITSVSIARRRVIFISGFVVEVIVMLSLWYLLSQVSFTNSIQYGIYFALALRLCVCPLNLVPFSIGDVRSDGWRIVHPDSIS